jgi:hypothetical protein
MDRLNWDFVSSRLLTILGTYLSFGSYWAGIVCLGWVGFSVVIALIEIVKR